MDFLREVTISDELKSGALSSGRIELPLIEIRMWRKHTFVFSFSKKFIMFLLCETLFQALQIQLLF